MNCNTLVNILLSDAKVIGLNRGGYSAKLSCVAIPLLHHKYTNPRYGIGNGAARPIVMLSHSVSDGLCGFASHF